MGRRRCRRPTDVGRETILHIHIHIHIHTHTPSSSRVVAYQIIDYGEDGEDRHILVDYIKC